MNVCKEREKDKEFVGHIVRNLEAANQDVTKELMVKRVCVCVCLCVCKERERERERERY